MDARDNGKVNHMETHFDSMQPSSSEARQRVKDETDEEIRKEGAAVAFELGLHDLHPEILRLMGPAVDAPGG